MKGASRLLSLCIRNYSAVDKVDVAPENKDRVSGMAARILFSVIQWCFDEGRMIPKEIFEAKDRLLASLRERGDDVGPVWIGLTLKVSN